MRNIGTGWTEKEDNILREQYNTMKAKDLAKKLQRTTSAVRQRAQVIGVNKTSKHSQWTEEQDQFLIDFYDEYSMPKLAKKLDKTENQIRTRAQKLGIYGTKRRVKESYIPQVKKYWTKEERMDVIKRFKAGEISSTLAKEYKTTTQDVESILSNYKEIKEYQEMNRRNRIIEEYNLCTNKKYIVTKKIIDKTSILKKKRASIIAMYNDYFLIATDRNVKEAINYIDLKTGDYVIKEVA